jgi:hypothetical protein
MEVLEIDKRNVLMDMCKEPARDRRICAHVYDVSALEVDSYQAEERINTRLSWLVA